MVNTLRAAVLATVAALGLGLGAAFPPVSYGQEPTPTPEPEATGSFQVIGISPLMCFLLTAVAAPEGSLAPVDCHQLDSPTGGPVALLTLADLHGDGDGRVEPSDFAGIDLDGNQIHQMDDWVNNTSASGSLWIIAFVNDDDPVQFRTTRGVFVPSGTPAPGIPSNVDPVDNVWNCDTFQGELPDSPEDLDCDGDGRAGDGVVVARLRARYGSKIAERGDGVVTIRQGSDVATIKFKVVGEPDSVEFITLESTIQAGVRDLDGDGALSSEGECPLILTPEAIFGANATAERALILGIVRDDDGTAITGSLLLWSTDDEDKAVTAGPLTPTVDLGSFGFGAPNIVCGTKKPGTAKVFADISRNIISGDINIPADLAAEEDRGVFEFKVTGPPATINLKADPANVVCDGRTSSKVTATVLDSAGGPVAPGQRVRFDVRVLGTANPINTVTNAEGVASTTVTPLAGSTAGVPVLVTAGGIQASILIACTGAPPAPGAAPPPPPPPPAPSGGAAPGARQPGLPRSGQPDSLVARTATEWFAIFAVAGLVLTVGAAVFGARLKE